MMLRRLLGGLAILFLCFAAWSADDAELPEAEEVLPPNSCAITCPPGTAYAGMSAANSCLATYSPLCQCTDAERPMAGCERLTPETQ